MKWFHNMKIGAKLISSFILVAIIAGVVGVVGITNIMRIDDKGTLLYTNVTVPLAEVAEMSKLFQRVRVYTRDMILEKDINEVNAHYKAIEEIVANMNSIASEFEQKIISDQTGTAFEEFMAARVQFRSSLDRLLELTRQNRDEEAYALIEGEMGKAADAEQDSIDKLVELMVAEAKTQSDSNTKTADEATFVMLVIIAGGMILAIILGVFIARIIGKPVKKLSTAAELIANGDLNVKLDINTKDEVGHLALSFKRMADNLNDVMSNISTAAEQVASGAKQISDTSIALSQGATEQACSVEELTASLEEISTQTKLNAENANQVNSLAETAKGNAIQGNSQMKEMLSAMEEINNSSSSISKIIKVIDEIAFQTNILALNAAVEAARAGQHGKGFAVVAEEVRNLAARSANAAKETTDMIEGSIKNVEFGTKIANTTAEALNKIVEDITKVANIIGDIAVASTEQSSSISQVNQGIMQVADVVQTNSATSEESAAASQELSSQADLLKDQVSRFKLRRAHSSMGRTNRDLEEVNL